MASIHNAHRSAAKLQDGEWRRLFLEADPEKDASILTRGYNDTYRDTLARRTRKVAQGFNGDAARIPTAMARAIDIELHCEHLFLDVRNLQGPDGKDMSFEQFCEALKDPDYIDLWHLAAGAAASVGRSADEAKAAAVKN